MGLQFFQEEKIFHKIVQCLKRRFHHHSGTDLIADLFQIIEAPLPVFKRKIGRMQLCVMNRIGSFMAQKIAVRACFVIQQILFIGLFPDGQRDRCLRHFLFDRTDDIRNLLIGIGKIFPRLQHNRAEAECISLTGTGQNIFFAQMIALRFCV